MSLSDERLVPAGRLRTPPPWPDPAASLTPSTHAGMGMERTRHEPRS